MNARDGVRRLRNERRERGVCLQCGLKKPERADRLNCNYCLEQKSAYSRKRRKMMRTIKEEQQRAAERASWKPASNPPNHELDVFIIIRGGFKAVGYYNTTLNRWCAYHHDSENVIYWTDGAELPKTDNQIKGEIK